MPGYSSDIQSGLTLVGTQVFNGVLAGSAPVSSLPETGYTARLLSNPPAPIEAIPATAIATGNNCAALVRNRMYLHWMTPVPGDLSQAFAGALPSTVNDLSQQNGGIDFPVQTLAVTPNGTATKQQFGSWISAPLAQAVTISGTITNNMWGQESANTTNAGLRTEIYRYKPDGTITLILGSQMASELSTSMAVRNWTGTPTSTALAKGDRILFYLYGVPLGGTYASSGSVTVSLDGSPGAQGDAYIQFTENLILSPNEGVPGTTPPIPSTGTALYFTTIDTQYDAAWAEKQMSTTPPATAIAEVALSAAGPLTSSTWPITKVGPTNSSGVQSQWTTPALTAGVTITGPVAVSPAIWETWGGENGRGVCELWKYSASTYTLIARGTHADAVLQTFMTTEYFSLSFPDTALSTGDRLVVRFKFTDASAQAASATMLMQPGDALYLGVGVGAGNLITFNESLPLGTYPAQPAISQAAYGFYADGTESGSAALAAQNTAATVSTFMGDASLQLRMMLQSTTAAVVPAGNWRLQVEKNGDGNWYGVCSATEFLVDTYLHSNWSYDILVATTGGLSPYRGQSFMGTGVALTKAGFWVGVDSGGVVNGVFSTQLYSDSLPFGAGDIPITQVATTTARNCTTLIPGGQFEYGTFAGTDQLLPGTPYALVFACTNTASSAPNVVKVGARAASASPIPDHPGMASYSNDGVSWSSTSAEMLFEVWGKAHPSAAGTAFVSTNTTDGAATTNRLIGGTGSFVAGEVSETGLATSVGVTGNNFTELLFPITIRQASVANGDTLRFRIVGWSIYGIEPITYAQTPTINVTTNIAAATGYATGTGYDLGYRQAATGSVIAVGYNPTVTVAGPTYETPTVISPSGISAYKNAGSATNTSAMNIAAPPGSTVILAIAIDSWFTDNSSSIASVSLPEHTGYTVTQKVFRFGGATGAAGGAVELFVYEILVGNEGISDTDNLTIVANVANLATAFGLWVIVPPANCVAVFDELSSGGGTGSGTSTSGSLTYSDALANCQLSFVAMEQSTAITGDATWPANSIQGGTGSGTTAVRLLGQYTISGYKSSWAFSNGTASHFAFQGISYKCIDISVSQDGYQFFNDDNTEDSNTALAAQNTAYSANTGAGNVSLLVRMLLSNLNYGGCDPTPYTDWILQVERNGSGVWIPVADQSGRGGLIAAAEFSGSGAASLPAFQMSGAVGVNGSAVAQSFIGNGAPIKTVRFYMKKTGTLSGNVSAAIYAATGAVGSVVPTGSALATSTAVNVSSVGTSIGWIDFTFATPYVTTASTGYTLVVFTNFLQDGSNFLSFAYNNQNYWTFPGNMSSGPASWGALSNDLFYEIYANSPAQGYNSTHLTDGSVVVTNRLTGGQGSAFYNGQVGETGLVADYGNFTGTHYTELLYTVTLIAANLTGGDTLRFRVVAGISTLAGTAPGSTKGFLYPQTPTVTIAVAPTVFPTAGAATGTGYNCAVGVSVNAGLGTVVGTGYNCAASVNIFVAAGLGTAVGTGYSVTAPQNQQPTAGAGVGTGYAPSDKITVTPTAGAAVGTGSSARLDDTGVNTGLSGATGTGYATSQNINVSPTAGAAVGTGYNGAESQVSAVTPTAGAAIGTGSNCIANLNEFPAVTANVATGYSASPGISVPAQIGTAVGAGFGVTTARAVGAGTAVGTGANASPNISVPAGTGLAVGTGYNESEYDSPSANPGSAVGAGFNCTLVITLLSGPAGAGIASGFSAVVNDTGVTAFYGPAISSGFAPSLKITVFPATGAAVGSGYSATESQTAGNANVNTGSSQATVFGYNDALNFTDTFAAGTATATGYSATVTVAASASVGLVTGSGYSLGRGNLLGAGSAIGSGSGLSWGPILGVGAATATGINAQVTSAGSVFPGAGAVTAAGFNPLITINVTALTGLSVGTGYGVSHGISQQTAGAATATGYSAVPSIDTAVSPSSGAVSAAGFNAQILIRVAASTGTATATGSAASASVATVAAQPGAVVGSGYNDIANLTIPAPTGSGVAAGFNPRIDDTKVTAQTGIAVVTGFNGTTGQIQTILMTTGVATGAGFNASVKVSPSVATGTGIGTGYGCTISVALSVAASVGTATGTGFNVTYSSAGQVAAQPGSTSVAGYGATVRITVSAQTGLGLVSGSNASAGTGLFYNAATGSSVGAGFGCTVKISVSAAPGTSIGSGYGPSWGLGAQPGAATGTGFNVSAASNLFLTAAPGSILASGFSCGISLAVGAAPVDVVGTGYDAAQGQVASFEAQPGVTLSAGFDCAITLLTVLAQTGEVLASGYQPKLKFDTKERGLVVIHQGSRLYFDGKMITALYEGEAQVWQAYKDYDEVLEVTP